MSLAGWGGLLERLIGRLKLGGVKHGWQRSAPWRRGLVAWVTGVRLCRGLKCRNMPGVMSLCLSANDFFSTQFSVVTHRQQQLTGGYD